MTAVLPIDYNVSVQIYALDSYGNEISETPGSIFFQGEETNSSVYRFNDDANLSAVAHPNFRFLTWIDESDQNISSSDLLFLPSITKDRNLNAIFVKNSKSYEDIYSILQISPEVRF